MRRRAQWIAALLCCVSAAGCAKSKANQSEKKEPPEVLVTLPTMDEITDYEEFIGHTDAVYTVEVRARVTGYLDRVNFNDGDEVEKGSLLFQIDDRPYKAEFDRTEATLEQGKARLTRFNADHNRAVALKNRNAIPQEEFDRINGDFREGVATIGVYTAALDRAKLDLDFTKVTAPISGRLSRRMVDPGNLVQADVTALTSIVSLDPMYVYFDVDERTLLKIRRLIAAGKIKSRQEAEVPVLVALSDEKDFTQHRGTINFSDNKVDSSTGTLRLRGIISNPKPRMLSPGLFVRIRLPIGNPHKSIMIDEQAIGSELSNKYVYVIRNALFDKLDDKGKPIKDPKTGKVVQEMATGAFRQNIGVGSLNGGHRVVNTGLDGSDRVIISGLQRVKGGDRVTPILAKKIDDASNKVASSAPLDPPVSLAPQPSTSETRVPVSGPANASK